MAPRGANPSTTTNATANGPATTAADSPAKRIFDGDFSPTFMAELMLKDAGLALDLARAAKVPTPMLEETQRTYAEAVENGWGKEDFSAVTHVIEKRIGRRLSR